MKKKTAYIVLTVLAAVLLAAAALERENPERKARKFLDRNQALLEESYETGIVPADIGYQNYNLWEGGHPMMEFLLPGWAGWGSTYYGCYYSPDGVPLAFQNADVPLTEERENRWTWQAEGDNHGETSCIRGNWFFFRASF